MPLFTLPALPFGMADLEPYYDAKTVEIHYGKHHQTYTDKLNAAAESAGITSGTVVDILKNLNSYPENVRGALKNHGGGYFNHTFFWESLTPNTSGEKPLPAGALEKALGEAFGSFQGFEEAFSAKALNHFGSGWAWLVIDESGKLVLTETHDQVSPVSLGQKPLLTIDVWEHAYYLKYQNRRADFIKDFFMIINWKKVEERFLAAK